jgi:hypothetical protein
MQKLSFKKMSVLGLVLMGASALTAAVIPSKEAKEDHGDDNGRLFLDSATVNGPSLQVSCAIASSPFQCTATNSFAATTTGRGLADSFVGALNTDQTVGNTSQTGDIGGLQTSVVQ